MLEEVIHTETNFHPFCDKCKYLNVTTDMGNLYADSSIYSIDIMVKCKNYEMCGYLAERIKDSLSKEV